MTRLLFSWLLLGTLASTLVGCSSDGPGNGDGPGGGGGGPIQTEPTCKRAEDCSDGLYCNGDESCFEGECRRGTPMRCSDGIECTVDRCDETTRACVSTGPDVDRDGHIAKSCLGPDGKTLGDDCDDGDPLRYPGNTEICDPEHRDEDCDPSTLGFRDSDNDGYVDDSCCNEQPDGELECGEDCDDHKAAVNPESQELCDFWDNDCDGEVDEGVSRNLFHDRDHDGHGDMNSDSVPTCPGAVGFALVDNDCDDSDPEVFLGQFEICDGKDNNCDKDRLADEIEEQAPWYADVDEDTYGDAESIPVFSCYRIPGRVLSRNDCNDQDNKVNPNATEICDGKDNDCNGRADFRVGVNDFEDDDNDRGADEACGGDDCDDEDSSTSGGAEEVCDRIDNDCDGKVDEQTTQNIWYIDNDGDGWGVVIGSALASCDPLPVRATQFGDCDDTKNEVHPGTDEECDGIDNDCDGVIDEGTNTRCSLENAHSVCEDGRCQIFTCQPGYIDADNNPNTGCEEAANPTDFLTTIECTSTANCDDGNQCNGFESCASGYCRLGTPIRCVASPSVMDGDVTIRNSQDIRELSGIERITGSLTISGTSLTSLLGLERLRSIGQHLTITSNPFLTRLSGSALSNLEAVGGGITINGNATLINVDLPSLISARALLISSNAALAKLTGYGKLGAIEKIEISSNPVLTEVTAFSNLGQIAGSPTTYGESSPCLAGGLSLEENPILEEVSLLARLTQIGGGLCISSLYTETIELPKLKTVAGMRLRTLASSQGRQGPEILSFPALERATNITIFASASSGEYAVEDGLSEVSFPKLKSADLLNIDTPGDNLAKLEFPTLESLESLFVYVDAAPKLNEIVFPKLAKASSVSVGGAYPALRRSSFAALGAGLNTSWPTLSLTFLELGATFEKLSLTLLSRAESLAINMSAQGQNAKLPSAARMELPVLAQVNTTLSIQAPMGVAVGSGGGLVMPNLSSVGPANTGPLSLCTGSYDQQSQSYVGAACALVDSIVDRGYAGTPDTCDQCQTGGGSEFGCPDGNCGNGVVARQFGTATEDSAEAIVGDPLTNYYYVAGFTSDLLGAANYGGADIFVRKAQRSAGVDTTIWTTQLGTTGTDVPRAISVDAQGNIFVGGYTSGSSAGDEIGTRDFYLAKLDSGGAVQWTRTFGTTGSQGNEADNITSLTPGPNGGVFFGGFTEGSYGNGVNAGPGQGWSDGILGLMSTQGELLYTYQFGAPGHDEVLGLSANGFGGLYATGFTQGDLYADSSGGEDAFLIEFEEEAFLFEQFGTSGDDRGVSVQLNDGDPLVAGEAARGISPGSTIEESVVFVRQYNSSGTEIWTYEEVGADMTAMTLGQNGSIWVTGAKAVSGRSTDVYLIGLRNTGEPFHSLSFGSSDRDEPRSIATSPIGTPYIAGFTWGALDVTPRGPDAFVADLLQ